MIRKLGLLCVVITIVFIFVIPAQAIYCNKCGAQNPDDSAFCTQCGAKLTHLKEGSIYDQASEMAGQDKHDDAISLLENYLGSNPDDIRARICLAKVYLGKCDILKEKGDKQYKELVWIPLQTGRSILSYRDQYLPEGLHICAHSFLINDRPRRAIRYSEKAIKMSAFPSAEYYFVFGDACVGFARVEQDNTTEMNKARKAYEKVTNMNVSNDVKGLAYYKLAVMYSELGYKEKAKKALASALELAQKESLIVKARGMLESM